MNAPHRRGRRTFQALLLSTFLIAATLAPASADDHVADESDEVDEMHCDEHSSSQHTKVESSDGTSEVLVDGQLVTVTIDGEKVAFTDAAGDPIDVRFCVKGSTDQSGALQGSGYDTTDPDVGLTNPGGNPPDISYVVIYDTGGDVAVEPTLVLQFTKAWDGDETDLDDVDVTFSIGEGDDAIDWTPGDDPLEVTAGQTLTPISETVTGLDEDCTYTSDLPATYTVPSDLDEDTTLTIDVTNTLTCDDGSNGDNGNGDNGNGNGDDDEIEPALVLQFTKAWDGDETDLDDVDVTFTIGEGDDAIDWTLGDDPLEVTAGQALTPIVETVTGLDDICAYTSDLPTTYTVPSDRDEDTTLTIDVTNTVVCADVLGVIIVDDGPDDETDVVVDEVTVAPIDDTGVLGVSLDAGDTVRVASPDDTEVLGVRVVASGSELPRTGGTPLALLLFALASLLTGGLLLRSRPTAVRN
ncbi:MAG: hypothetical protein JJT89_16010 [Nitriliruptoraceae bacterium]|nr:hypothetical protein [Nitriliruptoraceae bacterium]